MPDPDVQPEMDQLDDAELMARVAQRDERAITELFDRYAGLLLGLARRVVGSTQEAEEILQEVLLQVWAQAGRYRREKSSVSSWLVLLTRSRAIDRIRSRGVRERAVDQLIEEAPPTHTSPEGPGAVLQSDRRQRLLEELRKLPEAQLTVLRLAFFEGLTQRQIAEREDIPLGTVKTRTLLGLRKLREALSTELHDLL